jgi:hypothetical protein
MTYYEIIFLSLIPIIFIGGLMFSCSLSYNGEPEIVPVFALMAMYLSTCMVLSTITDSEKFTMTAEVPVTIVHRQMIGDEMVLLTSEGEKINYSIYKDVVRAKAEEPMVKRYYFKKNSFGFDTQKEEIEFK